jgi:predicted LPLAT superfamily acyltransferase
MCLVLNSTVVWAIYCLAGPQRRAVLDNLKGLRPDFGPLRRWWAGYQVFHQFALTYLDRLWHMHFKREVTWDIPDLKHFEEMRAQPGGVLVFTIHSGNYDIGATLFAQKFGRTLHMVRVPEQTEELQELRAAELKKVEDENPHLRVHYNEVDSHLGLELCRILMAGEAVAVQGDRVVTGVSPIEMDDEGVTFKIPRGPLVLAEIARVPCYPIFLQRMGTLKYRIVCGPCFYDGKTKQRADDLGKVWLPIMHRFVHEHWDQWFVFESLVKKSVEKEEAKAE